jgi:hypothetical protein
MQDRPSPDDVERFLRTVDAEVARDLHAGLCGRPAAPESRCSPEQRLLADSLRIKAWFPGLTDPQRWLLEVLYGHRAFLIEMLNLDRRGLRQDDLSQLERTVVQTEATFVALARTAKDRVPMNCLSQPEQQVFASQLLEIPWAEAADRGA